MHFTMRLFGKNILIVLSVRVISDAFKGFSYALLRNTLYYFITSNSLH